MKCISLKNMKRFQMIDNLSELGYNRNDLFEMGFSELTKELYNKPLQTK